MSKLKDIYGRKFDTVDIYRKIVIHCETYEQTNEVIKYYFDLGYDDLGIEASIKAYDKKLHPRTAEQPKNIVVGNEDKYIYFAEINTYTPRPEISYKAWKSKVGKKARGAELSKKLCLI